jgi:hypothetical protein
MYILFVIILAILLVLGGFFVNVFFRGANGEWMWAERFDVLKHLFTKSKHAHKKSDKAGRVGV